MNTDLPQRKNNRLPNYDYSKNGAYFITICSKNRKNIFWEDVGGGALNAPNIKLSPKGEIARKYIISSKNMKNIIVEKFVILPDHIHLIITVNNKDVPPSNETSNAPSNGTSNAPSNETSNTPSNETSNTPSNGTSNTPSNGTSRAPSPTGRANMAVARFVAVFKRFCNKEIGQNIFQRSYYDHIIRDSDDYKAIWKYIDDNPINWLTKNRE